jgi:hypothetical protein
MAKTRLRTAAMDTDKGTVPHSEITGVEKKWSSVKEVH